jgi:hypothetical protein
MDSEWAVLLKKMEFCGKQVILAGKPVAAVATQISLHFSNTCVPKTVLPYASTPTFRALNFVFTIHGTIFSIHQMLFEFQTPQKNGVCGKVIRVISPLWTGFKSQRPHHIHLDGYHKS